jgi:hypothetical protein
VFILGFHRSGTSILYKMIQSTGEFNSVTTYHVMQYDRLVYNKINNIQKKAKEKLNNFFIENDTKDRGIDRLKMESDLPLEYAFLIDQGYLFNKLDDKNIEKIKEVCKKIQFVEGIEKKLLLKNPWDFANFLFIKEKIPEAKFVFIHRHPYPVINSSLKALRTLTEQKTVYSEVVSPTARKLSENPALKAFAETVLWPKLPLALPLIVEHHKKHADYFTKNINKLKKSEYVNVTYEELCANPSDTIGKIVTLLNLKENNLKRFEKFIKPRNLKISDDVKHMKGYIYKRLKTYCNFLGYEKDII